MQVERTLRNPLRLSWKTLRPALKLPLRKRDMMRVPHIGTDTGNGRMAEWPKRFCLHFGRAVRPYQENRAQQGRRKNRSIRSEFASTAQGVVATTVAIAAVVKLSLQEGGNRNETTGRTQAHAMGGIHGSPRIPHIVAGCPQTIATSRFSSPANLLQPEKNPRTPDFRHATRR